MNAALAKLPKLKKIVLNRFITDRNENRELKHHQHIANPARFPDDALDLSSLITISSDGSQAVTPQGLFSKFSPSSSLLLSNIFGKRLRDLNPEDSPEQKAKQQHCDLSEEVQLVPGATTNHGFNRIHFELDKHKIYLPLSLFTNANLIAINCNMATLPLQKINPLVPWGKAPHILDTKAFRKKFGREDALTHQAWIEATQNYVWFVGEVGKDGVTGDWYKGWDQHFSFFESQTDAVDAFPAMLELEICMQKDYNSQPFAYDAEHYEHEYEKAKLDVHIWICKSNCPTSWCLPFSGTFGKNRQCKGPGRC